MRKEIVGNDKVFIGRLADTDVREFAFDLSEYTSCMDGEFSVSCLFVLPNKSDSEAYAIAIDHYRIEGTDLIWIPTNAECSETGWGKFEAILYNGGQQVASLIWRVQVGKSLVGDEEPPEGWENYILAVERLVDRIEDMTASASVDNTTGTPSVTVTKTEDPLNLDFAFHNIKGAKGDKGDTGSKGETGNGIVSIVKTGTSGLVDTYTITYDNGDTDTFTVTNGEKGDKGDKGDKGNTGATPDIYTTAVTLAEGSSAYAHVSGTIEQPLITFGIPKGDTGAQPPLSDDLPLMDGTASAGADTDASRSDHVHPHDTDLLPTDTVSGNPVAVSDAWAMNAEGLSVNLEPIQDLHGNDAPWPAGGGKNVFPNAPAETKELYGIKIISDGKGTYTISGTASATGAIFFDLVDEITIPNSISNSGQGCLYLNNSFTAAANVFIPAFAADGVVADTWTLSEVNRTSSTYSAMGGKQCNQLRFLFYNGASVSGTISPMISNDGHTDYSYSPYSNICPITGRDEVTVTRTDGDGQQSLSLTIPLGQTVYGGTVDVTSGVLTVDKAKYVFEGDKTYTFSSTFFYTYLTTGMAKSGYYLTENGVDINYNPTDGQIRIYLSRNSFLTSESDMDDYLYSGIGFVYDLPTPITVTLTPQQLMMLLGDNVVTSDGTITLTYKCEIQKYIQKLIASLV